MAEPIKTRANAPKLVNNDLDGADALSQNL